MRNIRIILEYDGEEFAGWCCQPGQRTIEEELWKSIKAVTGEDVKIKVAGRTDAGVHAFAQVINFRTKSLIPVEKFPLALMQHLPKDIVVKEATEADLGFDARKSAKARIYNYNIVNSGFIPVRLKNYAWHVKQSLDVGKMKRAAKKLVGTHNFKSFCKEESYNKTFFRRIHYIKFLSRSTKSSKEIKFLDIKIMANAFLHNMVRVIIGTLVEVGRGRFSPEDVGEMLKQKDRRTAGVTAPAKGLTLVKVDY